MNGTVAFPYRDHNSMARNVSADGMLITGWIDDPDGSGVDTCQDLD